MTTLPNPFSKLNYIVPQPRTQREAVDDKIAEVEKVLKSFKAAVRRSQPKAAKKSKKRSTK